LNRTLLRGIAAGVFFAAGIAALIAARYAESVCTATNASGQRVVIGTELNDAGRQYKSRNPADDNNAILEALGGRGPEAAWTEDSISRCHLILGITGAVRIPLFLLALVAGGAAALAVRRAAPARRKGHQVFLSYSHEDAAVAARLHRYLQAHGIPVLIDSEAMTPGERIQDFIAKCIQKSDVVVSLVSSRSLLSAWVASETIQTLQRNRWAGDRRFIGCYLDEEFFAPESRLRYTRQIDDRLQRIEELIPQYASGRIDTVDLNEEKTRLYELRNNLGLILATLKDSLCLDLREDAFEPSAKRLVAAIRSGHPTA
jgi:hypothetical protein